MQCPYCDSILKVMPDSGTCPRCGGSLADCIQKKKTQRQELVFPEPPIGIYRFSDGYLQIAENSVKISKKIVHHGKVNNIIPYKEIVQVSYAPGKTLRPGFLSIRTEQDKYVPDPNTILDEIEDKGVASVHKSNNDTFYRIYLFLKECADIANAAKQDK